MSCTVCWGYPGCPVCSPEPVMIECPECNGSGYNIYYEGMGEVVEECECCKGEGMIEDNE